MKTNCKSGLFLALLSLFLFSLDGNAQFLKKLGKRAEKAAERTIERRVEKETSEKTDQALDSILEPGSKGKQVPQTPNPPSTSGGGQENTSTNSGSSDDMGTDDTITNEEKSLEVYSKFDYVPGDKQLFFDNFENDFIGDFPSKWNTDGGGEVVKVSGSEDNWFEMVPGSYYIPDVPQLPEEYTIEFDLLGVGLDRNTSSGAILHVILDEGDNFSYGKNTVFAYLPFCQYIARGIRMWNRIDGENTINNTITTDVRDEMLRGPHISIAVNQQRYRLWINEEKHIDIPRVVPAGKIKTLKFEPVGFKDGKEKLLITNLKVAEGGVDLRRKLLSEGKISTNAILFDSGSANLQPQSMGIIRQIFQVLQQDTSINLKIVGHTDADGADDANLALSKKRADAVKNALVYVYNVDGGRLSTEGKGETEPVGDNNTADGKSQNRRVEFIKQ